MSLTQVAFMAVLLTALTAAFARGGRAERAAGAMILAASLVSPLVQITIFGDVEIGIALVDAALFLGLLVLALASARSWVTFAAAFQAIAVLTHVARFKTGPVSGNAYGDLLVLWSYPVLLLLMWGSLRGKKRPAAAPLRTVPPVPVATASLEPSWRHDQQLPAEAHDLALLTRLLNLHQLGPESAATAAYLLERSGSFGAAVATPPSKLRAWGMDLRVVDAFAFARTTTRAALRRTLDGRPSLANAELTIDYLHNEMAHLPHEQFRILYLNARYRLILDEIHGEGSISEAPLFPREVVKQALEAGAAHIILAHNHPSRDPTPSRADIAATRAIIEATRAVGVGTIDHYIISASGHVSMRALGML